MKFDTKLHIVVLIKKGYRNSAESNPWQLKHVFFKTYALFCGQINRSSLHKYTNIRMLYPAETHCLYTYTVDRMR